MKIILPIYDFFICRFSTKSYSQEGEDRILDRLFSSKDNGFYIDVGAHHPKRFSNTFFFYKKGWSGINIDAMPGSMKLFSRVRPRDNNLELAISDKRESLTYYAFNDSALNGFSKDLSLQRDGIGSHRIIFQKTIETETLANVLDENLPIGKHIDFLTIDVEGLDFSVIKSNDWNKYRPEAVLIEVLDSSIDDIRSSDLTIFMISKGYILFAKTCNTVFFRLQSFEVVNGGEK